MPDTQLHTYRSHDGRSSLVDHCEAAIAAGLPAIGVTDHKDFAPGDPVVGHYDYDTAMLEVSEARARFAGRLTVWAGIEVDYQARHEDRIGPWLDAHPFDFVIGSVHHVDGVQVMGAEYNSARDRTSAYADYFTAVRRSAASGLFDIIGHLEYANRRGVAAWGAYDADEFAEQIGTVFDEMERCGAMLEVNTSGLQHGHGMMYPCERTVTMWANRGHTAAAFGSDAHASRDLASGWRVAADTALRAGIGWCAAWTARTMSPQPIMAAATTDSG